MAEGDIRFDVGTLMPNGKTFPQIQQEIIGFLESLHGDLARVHFVLPDYRSDRVPWIEVRMAIASSELEDMIESGWSFVDIDFIHVEEDDL